MQSFVTVSAALLHAMDLHRRLLKGEGSTYVSLFSSGFIYLQQTYEGAHSQALATSEDGPLYELLCTL